jgi:hypothetical protein
MPKTILLFLVFVSTTVAQPFGFGIKGGVPLGDAFEIAGNPSIAGNYFNGGHQFVIGPFAELRLPFGIAVEGDILFTRYNFNTGNLALLTNAGTSHAFEFPILVKKRFGGLPLLHPFVGAGPTFRNISDVLHFSVKGDNQTGGKGFVFGAGVEAKLLFVRIAPEIRFTHWGSQNFRDDLNILIRARQNQGQFLIGISF